MNKINSKMKWNRTRKWTLNVVLDLQILKIGSRFCWKTLNICEHLSLEEKLFKTVSYEFLHHKERYYIIATKFTYFVNTIVKNNIHHTQLWWKATLLFSEYNLLSTRKLSKVLFSRKLLARWNFISIVFSLNTNFIVKQTANEILKCFLCG